MHLLALHGLQQWECLASDSSQLWAWPSSTYRAPWQFPSLRQPASPGAGLLGAICTEAQRLFPPSTALHSLHGFNLPQEPKTRTPHSSHTTLGNDYLGNESCCTEVSYSVLLRVWLQDTRLALTLERESAHPLTNINSVVCKEFPNPCLSIISAHTHLSHKIDISVRQQNTL